MDIYQVFDGLGIGYEKYEHPAVFTVEEAEKYDRGIVGGKTKNLFLENKSGDSYYLVVMAAEKRADMKKLAVELGEKKLSFAPEEKLMNYLGLTPGSVSPLGLINDKEKVVRVVIDQVLFKESQLGFHPNVNTATVVINTNDFKKFLDWAGNKVSVMEI